MEIISDPHRGQPLARAGRPLAEARTAMILLHGRGATASGILELGRELGRDTVAYLAPQAAGGTWYPLSFLAPIEQNEPGLSSGLRALSDAVARVEETGIPAERILLLGFSQGACLTSEFTARHPRRWGGVAILTGGVIGPPGTPREYPGSLEGTPIFLGSSDPDPHVPWARVDETAEIFRGMGAEVTLRRYPGMPHTVNAEELDHVRRLLDAAEAR